MNPWGLTEAEARVMDALCDIGVDKRIARHLDVSSRTVEHQLRSARQRMNAGNRLLAALWWDRYRRAHGQEN